MLDVVCSFPRVSLSLLPGFACYRFSARLSSPFSHSLSVSFLVIDCLCSHADRDPFFSLLPPSTSLLALLPSRSLPVLLSRWFTLPSRPLVFRLPANVDPRSFLPSFRACARTHTLSVSLSASHPLHAYSHNPSPHTSHSSLSAVSAHAPSSYRTRFFVRAFSSNVYMFSHSHALAPTTLIYSSHSLVGFRMILRPSRSVTGQVSFCLL